MIAKLPAAERIRILQDRIHHLNINLLMDIEERLEAIFTARLALKKAEKDLTNGNG